MEIIENCKKEWRGCKLDEGLKDACENKQHQVEESGTLESGMRRKWMDEWIESGICLLACSSQ